jgi:iron complex transport system permease protein
LSLALLASCAAASFALGARAITLTELADGLFRPYVNTYGANVARKRVARTMFALLCGGSLGVSGALTQSVTRNPIADPSILGVNTGAALSVVCGIAFLNITTAAQYMGMAMAGAALTAAFVYAVGSVGRDGATPIKLALAGAAVSAALSSMVSAVLLPRSYVMDQYRYWQVGSVGSGTWAETGALLPFFIVGTLTAVATAPALNALAMGDEAATGLGVRAGLVRLIASMAGVALCGAVTAMAGPIGFIGLLAPRLARMLAGADLRRSLPMSALLGAVTLTASDVIGRLLTYPGELEVGVVTAFVGAPILIYAAVRSRA